MENKFALIIGNSEYIDPTISRLKAPDADVYSLADILLAPEVGGFTDVKICANQSFADIQLAIADLFAEKRSSDLLLIYFSGHGILDDRGELYLAAKNTRRNRVSGSAISTKFIAEEMDNSLSKRQILILDCCYSGAFGRGTKGDEQKAITKSTFKGNGFGRVVLTASDATQQAWEGDKVISEDIETSVFTHFLLEGLRSGDADMNNDSQIDINELYDYVFQQIKSKSIKQTPRLWTYKQEGSIFIAKKPMVSLPDHINQGLENSLPEMREVALNELQKLLKPKDILLGKDLLLGSAVLQKIKQLSVGDSDAHIREIAKSIIEGLDRPGRIVIDTSLVKETGLKIQKEREETLQRLIDRLKNIENMTYLTWRGARKKAVMEEYRKLIDELELASDKMNLVGEYFLKAAGEFDMTQSSSR